MRRVSSIQAQDVIIWSTCLLLAAVLGTAASYVVSLVLGNAHPSGPSLLEMIGFTITGLALIVLALQGRLVRAFLISFAIVFFIGLALSLHAIPRL